MYADCRFLFLSHRLTWFQWEYINKHSRIQQQQLMPLRQASFIQHTKYQVVLAGNSNTTTSQPELHQVLNSKYKKKNGELHDTPFKEASSESTAIPIHKKN